MKNAYILPTENYKQDYTLQNGEVVEVVRLGQLIKHTQTNEFLINKNSRWAASCDTDVQVPHHIYITCEEKLMQGDWFLDTISNTLHKAQLATGVFSTRKKIILTTDQDLIKEGVQAINDDFLDWFVKNPNCEYFNVFNQDIYIGYSQWNRRYSILIPKEESKVNKIEEQLTAIEQLSEEQLTGVEWFAQELYEKFEMKGDGKVFDELLEKARKREKKRGIEFAKHCLDKVDCFFNISEYYDEFKNK